MVLQIYRIQMPAVPVAPGVRVQLIGVSQDAFSQDPASDPTEAPVEASSAAPRESLRVAVLFIGAARAMVWPAVCENIRRRFLDAIQKPIPGEATWSMDVFFFLALDDPPDGKIDQWRVQRDVNAAQLEYCKELLRPVHTEFMPPTYPMPKHHNCTPGHEPSYAVQTALWNVPGASERMYAQCYRQQIAYDYVLNTHEPQHGVRYDALIRARPDSIYLQDVPPISHFNLSRITTASTAPGDHWHIVHRGCSGPKRRYCLRCQGSEYDEHCRNETVNVDVAVQAVVAREKPLSFARKMKLEKAKVPERSGKSKDYGMLVLECDRWKKYLLLASRDEFDKEPSACSSLQGAFLGAPPPVTPVSRRVVAVAPENSAKPEGAPAVAVLIIGAARAMVWPEVCENIQENLVKGLASLGPDGQHWRVDVFFFLALEESIQARDKTMIRHSFEEELLKPCQDLMKPVHVDWMPPSYPMPGASNCKAGQEPWYVYPFYKPGAEPEKVLGADERMYSQCKRIQIAYDYVTQEFEPKVGLQYQAFLRARPDGVYLHPVPPMGSFALSQLTISATAPGDHWHLIHRGCLGPFERRCLRCRGKEYDKRCPKPKKVLDLGVQEVIARERSADVVSELLGEPLTGRGGAEGFGFLWLECDRWEKLLNQSQPKMLAKDPSRCRRLQRRLLDTTRLPQK
ncbi:unnamed protein product [Durusdinium trenchii]